ncbi:MAG: hypothetical protein JXX29_02100 [Deltaproteobacteria bacterium]|nr:hypothetical protein [Deltaproteobacteria bacterium]MBN2670434.1 hypothetical protein [Deltaproteobacteria bacterium]
MSRLLLLLLYVTAMFAVACGSDSEGKTPTTDADTDTDTDSDADSDTDSNDADTSDDTDTGLIPLTSEMTQDGGFVVVGDGVWTGYSWTTAQGEFEGEVSTITPEEFTELRAGEPLCASGQVVMTWGPDTDNPADTELVHTYQGLAMIGVNVNQARDTDTASTEETPAGTVTPTGNGLRVVMAWRQPGAPFNFTIRVQLSGPNSETDELDRWCYQVQEEDLDENNAVVIPWSEFHSYCYDVIKRMGDEGAYTGQEFEAVVLQVSEGNSATRPYDMCLADIAPFEGEIDSDEPVDTATDTDTDTATE